MESILDEESPNNLRLDLCADHVLAGRKGLRGYQLHDFGFEAVRGEPHPLELDGSPRGVREFSHHVPIVECRAVDQDPDASSRPDDLVFRRQNINQLHGIRCARERDVDDGERDEENNRQYGPASCAVRLTAQGHLAPRGPARVPAGHSPCPGTE